MEEINFLLELFEEKLEICKINCPKLNRKKKAWIENINVKKISWMQFLEMIILRLQIYHMKSENKKPGKKAKQKKKQLFEKMKNRSKNPFKYGIIIVNLH